MSPPVFRSLIRLGLAIAIIRGAGLLVESIHKSSNFQDPKLAGRLERAETVLNDAIKDLRYNLTELHSKSFEPPFSEALRKISDDPRFKSLVDIELKMDLPKSESLTPIRSEHVLAIVNEALSNIIRHSRAKNVTLSAQKTNQDLRLTIEDDGIGIPEIVESGYGLRNMRDRARLLGGDLVITPKNGKGTIVTLEITWSDER